MIEYGLEWHALDTYFQVKEITAPATPPANHVRQYATDSGGTSTMCWINDAGATTCLNVTGGTVPTGSSVADRVAFWLTATTLTGDNEFTYDNTNNILKVAAATGAGKLFVGLNTLPHTGADGMIDVDKDGTNCIIAVAAHSTSVTDQAALHLIKSRGTHAAQTIIADGDILGSVIFKGHGGTTIHDAASVRGSVDGSPGNNDMPARLGLFTTPDGSITLTEGLRVTSGQRISMGTTMTAAPIYTQHIADNTATSGILVDALNQTGSPSLVGRGSRGTFASPTATQADDTLLLTGARGRGATVYATAVKVAISQRASEIWTDSAQGTYFSFFTTNTGGTTLSEKFRLGPAGQFGTAGATYGTAGNLLRSGGASAVWTWQDHTADFLTQYALLAGRSGGQTLIGGTAAADDLILRATAGVGAGSESIIFQTGNNGAHAIATLDYESATIQRLKLNSESAEQFNLSFCDNGTQKWTFYKSTANAFNLYDHVASQHIMEFAINSTPATSLVRILPTINTTTANIAALAVNPVHTGANSAAYGIAVQPSFEPSSGTTSLAAGCVLIAAANPASGATISSLNGAFYRTDYAGNDGAVTLGLTIEAGSPTASGSLKPTTQNGLRVRNQGLASITTAVGIHVEAQSGATNNYTFELPATGDTPTVSWGAVSETIKASTAPAGYVKILVGGATRYMPFWA